MRFVIATLVMLAILGTSNAQEVLGESKDRWIYLGNGVSFDRETYSHIQNIHSFWLRFDKNNCDDNKNKKCRLMSSFIINCNTAQIALVRDVQYNPDGSVDYDTGDKNLNYVSFIPGSLGEGIAYKLCIKNDD